MQHRPYLIKWVMMKNIRAIIKEINLIIINYFSCFIKKPVIFVTISHYHPNNF
jgi:hypothetical protein